MREPRGAPAGHLALRAARDLGGERGAVLTKPVVLGALGALVVGGEAKPVEQPVAEHLDEVEREEHREVVEQRHAHVADGAGPERDGVRLVRARVRVRVRVWVRVWVWVWVRVRVRVWVWLGLGSGLGLLLR